MENKFYYAKKIKLLAIQIDNKVSEVYLIVEYKDEKNNINQNAIHLGKRLSYDLDGLSLINQEVCNKAFSKIRESFEIYIDLNNYCLVKSKEDFNQILKSIYVSIYN